MKKATRIYGIITIVLIAFTLSFSTVSMANDGDKDDLTEMKYIGTVKDQPLFQLTLTNTEEDEFTVTFRDDNGHVIYDETFTGANISKKFLLKSEDKGYASLNVVVKSKKNNDSEVYIINRSHGFAGETVVNKVK